MSDQRENPEQNPLERTYEFDKFVEDLERREEARREALRRLPVDHNQANRLRDSRNRETVHNRIRWVR